MIRKWITRKWRKHLKWEKIVMNHVSVQGLVSKYIENPYQKNHQTTQFGNGKRIWIFSKYIQMAKQAQKEMPNIISIREMQIQTACSITSHLPTSTHCNNSILKTVKVLVKLQRTLEALYLAGKVVQQFLKKTRITVWSHNSTPRYIPHRIKNWYSNM